MSKEGEKFMAECNALRSVPGQITAEAVQRSLSALQQDVLEMQRKASKRQEEMNGSVADRIDAVAREVRRLKAKDEDRSSSSLTRPTTAFVEEQISRARTETLESVRDLVSKVETRLEGSISSASAIASSTDGNSISSNAATRSKNTDSRIDSKKFAVFMEETEESVARAFRDIEKLRRECEEIAADSRKGLERCSRDMENKIKDASESTKAAARVAKEAQESQEVATRALSIARQMREEITDSRDESVSFAAAIKRCVLRRF